MRTILVFALGTLLFVAGNRLTSLEARPWLLALGFFVLGMIVQMMYARIVNTHLRAIGMPETMRARLRSDRGFPFSIVMIGILSKALFLAALGSLLLQAGCLSLVTTSGRWCENVTEDATQDLLR